jgi:osmotically-inducible protein OsmY
MLNRAVSLLMILLLVVPMLVAQTKYSADDRIYDEVRRKLANDVDVKGAGIEVAVKNGAVTLNGRVHTAKGKEKAERIVKKIKGVTSVVNQLTVMEGQ